MDRILVVEDDTRLIKVVVDWLEADGYGVTVEEDGTKAMARLNQEKFDLLILDWSLPGMSGLDICKHYRSTGGSAPVLMLTGKGELKHKEEGLDSGADDYLTKPFNPRELSARLRALLRRRGPFAKQALSAGNLVMNPDSHSLTKNGSEVQLLPKEFQLLQFMMGHPNKVFSANDLLDNVWSNQSDCSPDTVRVHIMKLRSKIDDEGAPSMIRTVHRVGYMFAPPDSKSQT